MIWVVVAAVPVLCLVYVWFLSNAGGSQWVQERQHWLNLAISIGALGNAAFSYYKGGLDLGVYSSLAVSILAAGAAFAHYRRAGSRQDQSASQMPGA